MFTDASTKSLKSDPNFIGSTGWEYAFGVYLFGDKLVYTEVSTSRDYYSVKSSYSPEIKTSKENDIVTDTLFLNSRKAGEISYSGNERIKKRNEQINSGTYPFKFIANVHTHPIMTHGLGHDYYSFFSPEDLYSFINSKAPLTFLVTNKLWLLCMTSEFELYYKANLSEVINELLAVSRAEHAGTEALYEAASNFASKFELGLYVAEFGSSFYKV